MKVPALIAFLVALITFSYIGINEKSGEAWAKNWLAKKTTTSKDGKRKKGKTLSEIAKKIAKELRKKQVKEIEFSYYNGVHLIRLCLPEKSGVRMEDGFCCHGYDSCASPPCSYMYVPKGNCRKLQMWKTK